MAATQALLCNNCYPYFLAAATKPYNSKPSISHHYQLYKNKENCKAWPLTKPLFLDQKTGSKLKNLFVCHAARRKPTISNATVSSEKGNGYNVGKVLQIILWVLEGVYILWLFLLPYAPGDPVWAISKDTVNSLIGLSLNFFFILPLMNSDCKRDRYQGSLDVLWGLQMFLTNRLRWAFCANQSFIIAHVMPAFLIPYMAIRLNEADSESTLKTRSQLGTVMTNGAPIVGLIGGFACLISAFWAFYGRMDSNFGSIPDRLEFLFSYLGSERLAYAFIWDICLYIIFQPWLIGENLQNIQKSKANVVNFLRFVPVVGLVAYLLWLKLDEEP
ncbi:hypothetical protein GH714_019666 [Hevea brasiliensis]|uniref:Uncharacterized protein n=1 Tax=Hevea brasiliensis TaxID=3981 RepID=A0A6A6MFB0_HEVBR|nr:hypothetical protein GH714_019666 [Hevea brasiliensis]